AKRTLIQQVLTKAAIGFGQAAQNGRKQQGISPQGKTGQQSGIYTLFTAATPVQAADQGRGELCHRTKRQQAKNRELVNIIKEIEEKKAHQHYTQDADPASKFQYQW